jgi:hypothetical protein
MVLSPYFLVRLTHWPFPGGLHTDLRALSRFLFEFVPAVIGNLDQRISPIDKLSEPLDRPFLLPLTPLRKGLGPSGVKSFLNVTFCLLSATAIMRTSANQLASKRMADLAAIEPTAKPLVIDLVREAGVDVSDWSNYKGANPSKNPKYCYNWSFQKPGELVVALLFHEDLTIVGDDIVHDQNIRLRDGRLGGRGAAHWKMRARELDTNLQLAYRDGLPIRAIILDRWRQARSSGRRIRIVRG